MGTVQNVGPFFNYDNVKVVTTDQDYALTKDDVVVESVSPNLIVATLPPNPELGESHKIVDTNAGTVKVQPNAGQVITFNPGGGGAVQTPVATCIVPAYTSVDLVWSGTSNGWIGSCCAVDPRAPRPPQDAPKAPPKNRTPQNPKPTQKKG